MVLTRILSLIRPDARLLDKLLSPPPLVNPAMNPPARLKELLNLPDAVDARAARAAALGDMKHAIEQVNAYLQENRVMTGVRFLVHPGSNLTYAELVDQATGRVMKIIPSQSMLEMAARLQRAGGILVDTSG